MILPATKHSWYGLVIIANPSPSSSADMRFLDQSLPCIRSVLDCYYSITIVDLQVTSVFEGLHEGRILCSAATDDNLLLTGGESAVSSWF